MDSQIKIKSDAHPESIETRLAFQYMDEVL